MTDYNLNNQQEPDRKEKSGVLATIRRLLDLMGKERRNLLIALVFILINSVLNLAAPFVIGSAVDKYVVTGQYDGVIRYSLILLGIFILAMFSGYTQAQMMGKVGQRMLFNLRNTVFSKLQELPIAFFNQNKAGDLISRINNDTDKINQFFSQSLVQFMSSIFTMMGAGVFLLSINWKLGLAALTPALIILIFTRAISPQVKKINALSMKSTGGLSAEIQESLQHFKIIVAFSRRDYFRKKFEEANADNYKSAMKAGIANNIFMPVYTFWANIGQLVVLGFGIYLITTGEFTIGLLISFIAYITQFYNPLRQIAALWANFQVALAGWDRISRILRMENNLSIVASEKKPDKKQEVLLEFRDVSFAYVPGKNILNHVNFRLMKGKTYAFVGPTGGGKTTTASLMARLYDPTEGRVLLQGVDIRSIDDSNRTAKIGFILQEPVLFSGNLRDNILYGNECFLPLSDEELMKELREVRLDELIDRFEDGFNTPIQATGDNISLGQKQIIAFIRAIIRRPDLLILDEATANIDTVTEQLLDNILRKLPGSSTKIIIAHRLNTIESADEIFFVNGGEVTLAGSLKEAVELLIQDKRES
jgi:ATP-binding cassette, subfamily B, bacterial